MLAEPSDHDTFSSEGGATSTDPSLPGVRHPKLYFEDGDIVLSSDSADQVTTFYRVDKIYLSRQSIVFQEMLGVPMSVSPGEMYDGVAWVRMPDPTDELEKLLLALYNVASLDLKRRHPNTPIELSGVMKLAKKYEVMPIRTLIRQHLEGDWPQNVEEWDDFQGDMHKAIDQHIKSAPKYQYGGRYIDERFPEAGSTIRFALDHNCPTLLRAASLVLLSASPKAEWDTVRRTGYDMQYEPLSSQRTIHFPAVRWHLLGDNGQAALKRGKEAFDKVLKEMEDPSKNVPALTGMYSCRQCITNLDAWREKNMTLNTREMQSHDPILLLKRLLAAGRPDAICGPCWERAEKAARDTRTKLWDEIPTVFGWFDMMSA
ncbi:hypothetical protein EUX98_g2220 [Antrodiella citrinella]|uniref:BTB domain-containing protein n=1 Tax=Antrodiella citrinella TaxID=2447956 RepID=A0A4V3XJ75_9APHY|nr:hypothetical protein EUX98_g2220 [Antrodiella citrinella]